MPPDASLEDLVDVIIDRTRGESQPVFAWQKKGEILALLERLAPLQPRRVLEIGTAAGGTLFLLSPIASSDALLVSIDKPEGHSGGGYNLFRAGHRPAMVRLVAMAGLRRWALRRVGWTA